MRELDVSENTLSTLSTAHQTRARSRDAPAEVHRTNDGGYEHDCALLADSVDEDLRDGLAGGSPNHGVAVPNREEQTEDSRRADRHDECRACLPRPQCASPPSSM
jgi:hypothetical protein